jgi:type IV secretory pathway VirB10-like protein
MTNPGATVAQADSTTPPQAGAPSSGGSSPAKQAGEPARPIEDPLPEPPRAPQYDELILPAAAVIGLQVETSLTSERARVEDRVDARVSRDVMVAGRVAIPAGSRVVGSVTTVERGGKVKDQARLGIRFHTLVLADGTQVQLHTDPVYRLGEDPSAGSTKKIGGAAIGGAIIGAILGGGKGAAIGGAAGAAGGTAATMAGDRNPATLHQGEYLNVKLSSPATITVERREQ